MGYQVLTFDLRKTLKILFAALLLAIVLGVLWKELFHYRVFPKRFGVVEPGLIYRSGQIHPDLIADVLQDNNIQVVVDLQYFEEKPGILAEQAAIDDLGLTRFRFPLDGNGTGDIESYVSAITALSESVSRGEAVLVHCAAGTQRTGGVIASYRTLVQGVPAEVAVAEMEKYKWDRVDDRILLEYLDEHIGVLAARLVETGVLSEVPETLPRFE